MNALPEDAGRGSVESVLAEVGHELAGPLSVASGFAQQLLAQDLPREHVEEAARAIDRNIRIARRLLANYRDATRAGDDPLTLDLRWSTVGEIVDPTVADAAATTDRHPLDVQHEDPSIRVLVDRSRVRQALFNLLTNALRHTPAGTPVHVRTRRDDGLVAIDVADEGGGVDPRVADGLFDPRVRAAASRGLGIGLYVARRVAEAHGGTLRLVETSERGATFRLRFPIEDDAPPPSPS